VRDSTSEPICFHFSTDISPSAPRENVAKHIGRTFVFLHEPSEGLLSKMKHDGSESGSSQSWKMLFDDSIAF
jgi:hypothetical protein